jgi:hypothetical protein
MAAMTNAPGQARRSESHPHHAAPPATGPARLDLRSALGGGVFEYAPAPESVRPTIADRYGLFINGRFTDPTSSRRFTTVNPANEQTLSEVAEANEADVDAAVRAARDALPAWSGLSGKDRGKYLYRIARRIQERARELCVLETLDGGKPIKESRDIDIPWRRRTSSTTRVGRTSCSTRSPVASPGPWACAGRSSRGTSRC